MEREPYIDETRYTLFNPKLDNTYFKFVYEKINEFFEVGRCRVIKMPPRTTLSWHRDPEKRIHLAIKTNYGARMFIEHTGHHIPADGNIYLTDNTKYHTAINGGEEDRIHLVATVLGTK
jgi:aspartyl/asparaginyl beta-hydroxylase (cupin superfamily)